MALFILRLTGKHIARESIFDTQAYLIAAENNALDNQTLLITLAEFVIDSILYLAVYIDDEEQNKLK
ncbi:hypothetical protein GCM10009193_27110 [Shewanella aestuarii]|nr:hypothetical protein GCM10009193_27110 [Shewanella aestuarii]